VQTVYAMDVPLNLHANGDAAIDAFLRVHERLLPATWAKTAR